MANVHRQDRRICGEGRARSGSGSSKGLTTIG